MQANVVIFIDDTNQDLTDFAHALEIPTWIYRIRKFLVNGQSEYYSPDQLESVIATAPEEKTSSANQDYAVVEQLGSGTLLSMDGKLKCYKLNDGRIIHIKRSKFHEKNNYYWYGINPNTLERSRELGTTDFVFVLGEWGFVVVPINTVVKYCNDSRASNNPDGSVRHYHALISPEPEPELYSSNETPKYDLAEYAQAFE